MGLVAGSRSWHVSRRRCTVALQDSQAPHICASCSPWPAPGCPFAAAAVAALLLGLNVARTYQERLRQFLSDIAGESGSSLAAAAGGGAKAD